MARTVSLYEAKTHLSALVEAAAAGEEIVVAKNGRPRARLVPLPASDVAIQGERPLGLYKGRIWIADDFDAPWPEDVRRALEGDDPDDPLNAPPPR